jgi:hypothetical protein
MSSTGNQSPSQTDLALPGDVGEDFRVLFGEESTSSLENNFYGDSCCGGENPWQLALELAEDGLELARDGSDLVRDGGSLEENGDCAEEKKLVCEGKEFEQEGLCDVFEALGLGLTMGGSGICDPVGPLPIDPLPIEPMPIEPMPVLGGPLTIQGNTVSDGDYKITVFNANHGTLTVKNTVTEQYFMIYGDPHIDTSTGGTANFQHQNTTFVLPDGTQITVQPTNHAGVNTIDKVFISKGDQTVEMTGFTTGDIVTKASTGDECVDPGTVIVAVNGNIGDLRMLGGPEIGDNHHDADIDK